MGKPWGDNCYRGLTSCPPTAHPCTVLQPLFLCLILQKLDKLYNEYTKKTRKLEDTLDLYEMKMARGKKLKKRKTVSCSTWPAPTPL